MNYTLNRYQEDAKRTAAFHEDKPQSHVLSVFALGVAGEAGEVADLVKKVVGHGHPLDKQKLIKELGDVLWYVAVLGQAVGVELEEIARTNIAKLAARYPNGFSTEASLNRPKEG